MKNRSLKQKGKRAVLEVRALLLKQAAHLDATDIIKPIGSRSGPDLSLSAKAKESYPFTFEVKNQEKINIWEAIEQSESHGEAAGLTPLLVFRRNRSDLYVTLKFEDLLKLIPRPESVAGAERNQAGRDFDEPLSV